MQQHLLSGALVVVVLGVVVDRRLVAVVVNVVGGGGNNISISISLFNGGLMFSWFFMSSWFLCFARFQRHRDVAGVLVAVVVVVVLVAVDHPASTGLLHSQRCSLGSRQSAWNKKLIRKKWKLKQSNTQIKTKDTKVSFLLFLLLFRLLTYLMNWVTSVTRLGDFW